MAKAEASVEELVSKIERGERRLPETQRRYAWRSRRVRDLVDGLVLDDDSQLPLPDALQERIDSGELFFWDAPGALDDQGQLQATGAIIGRRKLPWRSRCRRQAPGAPACCP